MKTTVTLYFENGEKITGYLEMDLDSAKEKVEEAASVMCWDKLVLKTEKGGIITVPKEILSSTAIEFEPNTHVVD